MSKQQFIYVTYIATTPEKLWNALIDGEMTRQYWRHDNISDWQPGSTWEHRSSDGSNRLDITGKVLEVSPHKRLILSWVSPENIDDADKYSRVTFDIEPIDDLVKLTVTHIDLEAESKMLQGISRGWPVVLSSLKTLLESGKPLPPWWAQERKTCETN